jgi:hypothetical protein
VREPFAQIGFFFETYLPLYDWYILEILYLPNTRLGYPSNCYALKPSCLQSLFTSWPLLKHDTDSDSEVIISFT